MSDSTIYRNDDIHSALLCHQDGRLDEAEAILRRLIEKGPEDANAWQLLGIIAYQRGNYNEAVTFIGHAVIRDPSNPVFLCNLGLAYHGSNDLDSAIAKYSQALAMHPRFPEALNNLGNAYRAQYRLQEALESYQKAFCLSASFETLYNMGTVCAEMGRQKEAAEFFSAALTLKPGSAEAYNNLGTVHKDAGDYEKASDCFQTALSIQPAYAEAHINQGILHRDSGEPLKAIDSYRHASQLRDSDALKIKEAMVLPVIPGSTTEILEWRGRLEDSIDRLLERDLRVDDPAREVNIANFYLAYHGLNDKELQVKISRLYEKACPSLLYQAEHVLESRKNGATTKIRIGFASRFLRNHTIGKYLERLILNLSEEIFEVYVYFLTGNVDDVSRSIAGKATKAISLPPVLEAARREIAADRLDIMFYPEIGMDPFTYFLAFARLARVQCAYYGHPDTTGIRNIDFFLSHEDCESGNDSRLAYSERVLTVPSTACYACYQRPDVPEVRPLEDFGLNDRLHVYLCPQALFKIHPDMDELIRTILEEDDRGVLVLFEGKHRNWTELLLTRITKSNRLKSRIRVLGQLPHKDFLGLIRCAHVVLDTPHFSGGNTSFDAFSVGTPIVTLPGAFMRGRQTYALYRKMGFMDCVTGSMEEYVARTVEIGSNGELRESIRNSILARNHLIFEDRSTPAKVQDLLLNALGEGISQGSASE